MLLASTAVLGISLPALIDDYVYVGGGASMQVLGAIEDGTWAYLPDAASFPAPQGGPSVRVGMWIIVNQKPLPEPRLVGRNWATVAAGSLRTPPQTSMLQSIKDAETYVKLLIDRLPGSTRRCAASRSLRTTLPPPQALYSTPAR